MGAVAQKVAADPALDSASVAGGNIAGAGVLAVPRGRARAGRRNNPIAYLFLAPALLVLVVFHFFPIFYAFYISLHSWKLRRGPLIGLDNYAEALRKPEFWRSFGNTVYFVLGTIPITLILALLFAYLLFQKVRFLSFFRTVYFLPYITSTVAAAAIWTWIFNPRSGILNQILEGAFGARLRWLQEPKGIFYMVATAFGAGDAVPGWLHGPSLALVSIMAMTIWHRVGFDIVIFLAGLGNINQELYEAARIDGAGEWDLFRRITLPLLAPTIVFLTVISTIGAFQTFNQIYVMSTSSGVGGTAGGPLNSTQTVVIYIYNQFYSSQRYGYGSAVAFILFGVILALTLVQLRLGRRREAV
ncbi:MAG: sugar ABC transporter permease [Chloroflexota bacterium]|nr:sugar ABC transporter permease [Chloroflexota bacterium]